MADTIFSGLKTKTSRPVIRRKSPQLLAFLHGTLQSESKFSKLRGLEHILKYIWTLVCEEWWDLHIDRFFIDDYSTLKIPELTLPIVDFESGGIFYPKERQQCAGCPVAVVAKGVAFPKIAHVPENSFQGQDSPDLYVNMMPFVLRNKATLPDCCVQYWPIIQHCMRFATQESEGKIGYLTIDERPVARGDSQRRRGLHVESPGVMPLIQIKDGGKADRERGEDDIALSARTGGVDMYIPGVEQHHWGAGTMMRDEQVLGGIFMASNVANTTAVWNCQIRDYSGEFIGPHGDVERYRELLGPCARTLDAGELVWMTDRTPHESLPVPVQADGTPVRRQYFRLVIGNVTAWYADHSTPNPLGLALPRGVRVVRGNKFEIYPKSAFAPSWKCGMPLELRDARRFKELKQLLYQFGLGHVINNMRLYGISSVDALLHHWKYCEKNHIPRWDRWEQQYSKKGDVQLFTFDSAGYYEQPRLEALIGKVLADREKAANVHQAKAPAGKGSSKAKKGGK